VEVEGKKAREEPGRPMPKEKKSKNAEWVGIVTWSWKRVHRGGGCHRLFKTQKT